MKIAHVVVQSLAAMSGPSSRHGEAHDRAVSGRAALDGLAHVSQGEGRIFHENTRRLGAASAALHEREADAAFILKAIRNGNHVPVGQPQHTPSGAFPVPHLPG